MVHAKRGVYAMPKRMRRIAKAFVFICLILFITSFLYSQNGLHEGGKSCLWKVETPNNIVYLMGSIHVLKKENYPLKSSIERAFADAQTLVFEINLDSAETGRAQMMILNRALYHDRSTLKESIREEIYQLAAKKASELGLRMEQFNGFKPWFFAMSLMAMKIQTLGFDPNYGIDKYFFSRAKQTQKEIVGLESIEYQIGLFDEMEKKDQEQLILQTLEELDLFGSEIHELVHAWESGDLKTLEEMVLKSFKEYPDVYRRFICQRNINWLIQIDELLKRNKNVLIIVGAGHLLGEDGIVAALRQRGYSVEQL